MFIDKVELRILKKGSGVSGSLRRVLAIQWTVKSAAEPRMLRYLAQCANQVGSAYRRRHGGEEMDHFRKMARRLVILVSMSPTRSAGPIRNDTSKPFAAKSRRGKIMLCLVS